MRVTPEQSIILPETSPHGPPALLNTAGPLLAGGRTGLLRSDKKNCVCVGIIIDCPLRARAGGTRQSSSDSAGAAARFPVSANDNPCHRGAPSASRGKERVLPPLCPSLCSPSQAREPSEVIDGGS